MRRRRLPSGVRHRSSRWRNCRTKRRPRRCRSKKPEALAPVTSEGDCRAGQYRNQARPAMTEMARPRPKRQMACIGTPVPRVGTRRARRRDGAVVPVKNMQASEPTKETAKENVKPAEPAETMHAAEAPKPAAPKAGQGADEGCPRPRLQRTRLRRRWLPSLRRKPARKRPPSTQGVTATACA